MPQKLLFIVNPNSGKGEIRHHAIDCIDRFIKADYEVIVYTTQKSGDATRIVMERGTAFDLIVCSGGDGTLNETVAGLMRLDEKPALGYIPAGTVNDFASSLCIPRKPTEATDLILRAKPYSVDVGRFNNRYFTYVAGFGAFTEVSYSTPQNTKNILGRMAYLIEGIKSLSALKTYRVQIACEDRDIEDEFVFGMVTNATSVGGFKGIVAHDVGLDDGLFEVFLVKAPANPLDIQALLNELLNPTDDNKFLIRFKASYVRFTAENEMPWTLDGEFGGAPRVVEITNCRQALHIFVGEPKK